LSFIESTAPATISPKLTAQSFPWIGTFHSIFLKILKQDIEHLGMKYTKNFGIFDISETQSVIRDVLKQM
jgi:DNA helicase-2/ATP-dependent DNA helicase PcrA